MQEQEINKDKSKSFWASIRENLQIITIALVLALVGLLLDYPLLRRFKNIILTEYPHLLTSNVKSA